MTPDFISKAEDATRGVLSCLRIDILSVGAACELAGLAASHFTPNHDTIYTALMDLWRASKPYDFIAVCERVRSAGALQSADALRAMLYEPVAASMAPEYIRLLLDCHAARSLYTLGQSLIADAFNASLPIADTVAHARAELDALTTDRVTQDTRLQTHLAEALQAMTSSAPERETITLGLGLDDLAGPFSRGDLVVLGAETKKGKSAIAGNIVENVARRGMRAAVFSLEMTLRQNAERMIASQARVNLREFKLRQQRECTETGSLFTGNGDNTLGRIQKAIDAMAKWRVEVIPGMFRISQIVSRMIQLKASGGLDLAVVDYAQLVEGVRTNGDNREREVASISRTLKRAADQTNCVVLLLSQLNDEGRLRESRAIGQDANCVLFLEGTGEERTIRVGAARSAPSGAELTLSWEQEYTHFSVFA